jgi:hypothetical protein
VAADAVFHQLAHEMTAPGVLADAVLPVMTKMQTTELGPHLPGLPKRAIALMVLCEICLGLAILGLAVSQRPAAR